MDKNHFPSKEERDPLSLFIAKSNSWVREYFWLLFAVLAICLSIFGLSLFYSYWQLQVNKKAAAILYQARKELVLAEKKAGGDILSFDKSQNFFEQAKKAKYNPEMDKSVHLYMDLIKKWILKPSGLSAASEMAHFLYQYDKKREAVDLLKLTVSGRQENLLGFLIAFQLGSYLMDQAEYGEAIQYFQFITGSKKAEWLWPNALISTALCHEKRKEADLAGEIYRRVKNDFPDSQSSEKAKRYLNLLQLNEKINKQPILDKEAVKTKETEETMKTKEAEKTEETIKTKEAEKTEETIKTKEAEKTEETIKTKKTEKTEEATTKEETLSGE